MARGMGLDDSVLWLGRRSDIPQLCEAADVLAMPSDWPELFGRALIEAMACGTPAVGANVGGIPEVLSGEFRRWVCPTRNAQAFADAFIDIHDALRADPDLSRRCREWVIQKFYVNAAVIGVEASLRRALILGRRRASHRVGVLAQGTN